MNTLTVLTASITSINREFNDYINSQIEDYCNTYSSDYSFEQSNEKFIDLQHDYIYENIQQIINIYKNLLLAQNITINEKSGSLHLISNFFSKNSSDIKYKYKNETNEVTCILITQLDTGLYNYYLEYDNNFKELNETTLVILSKETEFYLNEPKGLGKKNYMIAKFTL